MSTSFCCDPGPLVLLPVAVLAKNTSQLTRRFDTNYVTLRFMGHFMPVPLCYVTTPQLPPTTNYSPIHVLWSD